MKCQKCGFEFEGKFCPECGTPAVQEPETQYDKYKKPLRKYALTQIVFSILSLLFIILLLFVPIFSINFGDLSDSDAQLAVTLPDVEEAFEIWVEKVLDGKAAELSVSFSLYEEITYSISMLGNMSGMFGGIYQIFVALSIVMCIIMAIVACVKNVSGLYSFDSYAITLYDDIKTHAESKRRMRNGLTDPLYWIIIAVMFEVLAVVFTKAFGSQLVGYDDEAAPSYLMFCNGVSGTIVVVIIACALLVAAYVYGVRIKNKVKTDILREDYGISKK